MVCGSPGFKGYDLCPLCYSQISINQHACTQCADFIQPIDAEHPHLCGRCLSETPAFDTTQAPFLYQGLMPFLISGLKFNARYKNARLLGLLLSRHLTLPNPKPDLLIPMPLHPSRYRERGFNQALEIARTLSKTVTIPLQTNHCIRLRDTPHQTRLSAKQRRKNIKNAFLVKQDFSGKHLVIVDDVMTTGATANELALTLKKAGARRVDVWVCARA